MNTATKTRAPKTKRIKLEPKPLSEELIQQFLGHYKKHNSFPGSKIPCNVTGKLTTAVGPWLKKKIKEFGSPEALLRGYKCRQANKTVVAIGKKKKKGNAEAPLIKEKDGRYDIPQVNLNKPSRPLNETDLAKESETTCLRPDIYLNNGRHCEGCKYFKLCKSRLKNLPKHVTFVDGKFISTEIIKPKKK
jgi:hypothetical protein